MGLLGNILGSGSSGRRNPDGDSDINEKIIRMQENIREDLMKELKSEVDQDEGFDSKLENASSLNDVERIIESYGSRHKTIEDHHAKIQDKTKFLQETLEEAKKKGVESVAVQSARTNLNVLKNVENKSGDELSAIDSKLKDLEDKIEKRQIDFESAKRKLDRVFLHEEDFISKVERHLEEEWQDQYR